MAHENHPRLCGARNRQGLPCRQPAMRGKTRCRYHGGKSTGPRPKTHLYSRHLPEGVLDAFTDADIESLDEELRLAKAKLDWAVRVSLWNR